MVFKLDSIICKDCITFCNGPEHLSLKVQNVEFDINVPNVDNTLKT